MSFFFSTNKIHDVGPDRFLADELESTQPPVTQREPQFGLGICGLPAQVSLETNGSFLRSAHCLAPHPTLSVEVGFIRLRPLKVPNSGKPEFG